MSLDLQSAALLVWLAGATFALYGLLTVWVLSKPTGWFLRGAVLVGALSLPLLIGADSLVLTLVVEAATIIAGVVLGRIVTQIWIRWRTGRRNGSDDLNVTTAWRFSVRDALLFTALAGGVFAIVSHLIDSLCVLNAWESTTCIGIAMGFVVRATNAGVKSGHGLWRRGIAAVALTAGIGWLLPWSLEQRLMLGDPITHAFAPACWWHVTATTIALTIGYQTLPLSPSFWCKPAWRIPVRHAVTATMLILLLLPPLSVSYFFLNPTEIPNEPMPTENAWSDLRELAASIDAKQIQDLRNGSMSLAGLRHANAMYSDELDGVRRLLSKPCRVKINYEMFNDSTFGEPVRAWDAESNDRRAFINLAIAFDDQATLSVAVGRPDAAVEYYLDVIRLCHNVSQGGGELWYIRIDPICETYGLAGLEYLQPVIDGDTCRRLIQSLLELDAAREPWEKLILRDRVLDDRNPFWEQRLQSLLARSETEMRNSTRCKRRQSRLRRLICAMALRCHKLDHGVPPAELQELVPAYLDALPLDPFTQLPFIYHRTETGFLLYSVGANGGDDGGTTGPGRTRLDEVFEIPTRPPVFDDTGELDKSNEG